MQLKKWHYYIIQMHTEWDTRSMTLIYFFFATFQKKDQIDMAKEAALFPRILMKSLVVGKSVMEKGE